MANSIVTARRSAMRKRLESIPFLTLGVGFVGIVLLVPFGYTVVRSFFDNNWAFVGIDNYLEIGRDAALRLSVFNTLTWTIGALLIPVLLGLGIAVMTTAMRLGFVARSVVILPYALAGTVVAVIGNLLFTTEGSLNQFLSLFGIEPYSWMLFWPTNVLASILVASWQSTGVSVVLFMVGLQTIPRETVEAAAIDGADGWRRFRHVIFPQLRAITAVVIGMAITNALRAFDVIWVLTSGGPNRTSETLALSMYRQSFLLLDPAVGSAIAVVLAIVVVSASWVYLRRQIGHE